MHFNGYPQQSLRYDRENNCSILLAQACLTFAKISSH